MANKDNIIALPNPHLRKRSRRVGKVTESIKQLIADMEAATLDWEDSREHEVGVALAAIQIDKPLRVVVVRNNFDDKTDRTFLTLLNPEIIAYEGEIEHMIEGCLSVRDLYGKVPRHNKVRVKATGLNGRTMHIEAEGFLAQVLQHEIDHTNGIPFVDRIKDSRNAFYRLDTEGKLVKLNYAKEVKNNKDLWGQALLDEPENVKHGQRT